MKVISLSERNQIIAASPEFTRVCAELEDELEQTDDVLEEAGSKLN
jgi:hypothetical protein